MDNPYAWAILSLLSVIGFVYAIVCQRKNKTTKEMTFVQKSNVLIHKKQSKFDKLFISYDNQKVDDLCVSKIAIWNSGNTTISNTDIVETRELTFVTNEENVILDAEILGVSEETNKFSLHFIDNKTVKVIFDYIDQKDGMVVQIIHTGLSENLVLSCKIKGGLPLKQFNTKPLISTAVKEKSIFVILAVLMDLLVSLSCCLIMPFFMIVSILIQSQIIKNQEFINLFYGIPQTEPMSPLCTVLSIAVVVLICVLSIWFRVRLSKQAHYIGVPTKIKKEFTKE